MMRETTRSSSVLPLFLSLTVILRLGMADVVLIGNNVTSSFEDIEATFAPAVKGSGKSGKLYVAEPLDACSPLINKVGSSVKGTKTPFVLIIRGHCSFEEKVRRAQAAGFEAAIVYDDAYGTLVAMAGNAAGIKIHAVFVSTASGEILTKYAGVSNIELCIMPSFENSTWSIMALSFICLLSLSAVLATCFFVREQEASPRVNRQGMSRRLVKAMPSIKFKAVVVEESSTSVTCAICLEDYKFGDKLRMLPCHHKFHASCVDAWLTTWRTFCPVCKRDARTSTGEPPASESTPLLSSSFASSSSSLLSSARSSLASSSAIQIAPSSHNSSPSGSRIHHPVSIAQSSTPYMHHSPQSPYRQTPSLSASRSSIDLRNAHSHKSPASHLVSHYHVSTLNIRYMSHQNITNSPMNASSYVGSSSRQQNPLHCSESASSFSPFNSAQSLPGC